MTGILGFMAAGGAEGGFKAMGDVADDRIKSAGEKEKQEALFQRQKNLQLLSQKHGTKLQEDRQAFEKEQAGILSAEKMQSETDKTKSGVFMKGRGELTRRELELLSDEDRKQLLTGDQYAEYERSVKQEDADRKQKGLIELEEVKGKYKTTGKETDEVKKKQTQLKQQMDLILSEYEMDSGGMKVNPVEALKTRATATDATPRDKQNWTNYLKAWQLYNRLSPTSGGGNGKKDFSKYLKKPGVANAGDTGDINFELGRSSKLNPNIMEDYSIGKVSKPILDTRKVKEDERTGR